MFPLSLDLRLPKRLACLLVRSKQAGSKVDATVTLRHTLPLPFRRQMHARVAGTVSLYEVKIDGAVM